MSSEMDVQSWLISQNSSYREFHNDKPKRKASTIAITSGKGGVGKTTISLKMSKALSQMGHKVLLIDDDSHNSRGGSHLGGCQGVPDIAPNNPSVDGKGPSMKLSWPIRVGSQAAKPS